MAAPSPVCLPRETCDRYARLSLFNSPYPAHDAGRAVDCYPGGERAPSPVAGRVRETLATGAPSRPDADAEDHLILVDVDRTASGLGEGPSLVARLLHVDPNVAAGDRVAVGENLGRLVDSGYFAPWVDPHLHLGFRAPSRNLRRAAGSLPLWLGVDPRPLAWDGRGRVVATGETWAWLDAPAAGGEWVGLGVDGDGDGDGGPVLDGGFPHYAGGGALGPGADGPLSLFGTTVGDRAGRAVTWREVEVWLAGAEADAAPATGLSLFLARDGAGAKVVAPDHDLAVGDAARVTVRPGERPRLGRPDPR
jgi:hypothetical protein